jgi:pimeloyl-ACP methyl ester carboxylesterase
VQSYDLAGQYQSASAGPQGAVSEDWTYRLFIDDLLAILRDGTAPVHVLGYSFAGTVAQLALLEHPELFASLALLGAPPVSGQSFRSVRTIGVISPFTTPETAAALMIWGVRTNKNKAPSHRVSFVRERFELTNRTSVAGVMGLMKQTPEVAARLRETPHPKLVATGTHDLWPVELHRAFATRIGAEFASYRTGHSPCETTPYQLSRDLLALYSSTTPSS